MCNGVAIQLSDFPSKDESKVKVAYLVRRPFYSLATSTENQEREELLQSTAHYIAGPGFQVF